MQDMYQTFLGLQVEKGQGNEAPEDEYMLDVCKA